MIPAMKTIRWDRRRKSFILSDSTVGKRGEGFAIDTAMDVPLSSLRRALARQAGISAPPIRELSQPEVYENMSTFHEAVKNELPNEIVFFGPGFRNEALFLYLSLQGHLRVHMYIEEAATSDRDIVIKTVKRLFRRPSDIIQVLHYEAENIDGIPAWVVELVCDPSDRTVGSIWEAYQALCFALTTFPKDLAASVDTVQLALRLGRPETLLGTAESSWLEVKSGDYYRLASAAEKIKLAMDVARLANANGGLLVLGLRTSSADGLDVITRVTPLPMPPRSVGSYRSSIDAHVYPLIRGLDVSSVRYEPGELLVISVPNQSEDNKPFLVYGNLGEISGLKGPFVTIVERRSDGGAQYLSGPAIHGLLTRRARSTE
jgi:hypothetical protein